MRTAPFRYTRAHTVEEAVAALAGGASALAGGQSLVQVMKLRHRAPAHLVDVNGIPGLDGVAAVDGQLSIGALTRYATLATSAELGAEAPWLVTAAKRIADVQVRNRGTIGGNVAFAEPRANFPPGLLAMDAQAELVSDGGRRTVAVEELFAGFRRTAIAEGELLTRFIVPRPEPGTRGAYLELSRQPNDLSMVNVAVTVGAGGAKVAVGGLDEVPRRLRRVEAMLEGRSLDREAVAEATQLLHDEELAPPSDPSHGPPEYRVRAGRVLVERALLACLMGEETTNGGGDARDA